jgi:hypothetical protein
MAAEGRIFRYPTHLHMNKPGYHLKANLIVVSMQPWNWFLAQVAQAAAVEHGNQTPQVSADC